MTARPHDRCISGTKWICTCVFTLVLKKLRTINSHQVAGWTFIQKLNFQKTPKFSMPDTRLTIRTSGVFHPVNFPPKNILPVIRMSNSMSKFCLASAHQAKVLHGRVFIIFQTFQITFCNISNHEYSKQCHLIFKNSLRHNFLSNVNGIFTISFTTLYIHIIHFY